MKSNLLPALVASLIVLAGPALAAVRYVDIYSTNPTPPYDSWPTAAVTIQDAVDAADPGDQIIVTNGVYQSGGRIAVGTGSGSGSNRVAVTKPLVLQSVNGPEYTVIQAYSSPVTNLGVGAMRCVYLTNGASLSGFTLANGATWAPWGAGVWCQSSNLVVISNCVLVSNFAGTRGAGAYGGTLVDCVIRSNSTPPISSAGGGAWGSVLVNCTLVGNSSREGGGAAICTLTNCTLTGNQAIYGGGAAGSRLYNCLLTGNSADDRGGGTFSCVLLNCTVTENSAGQYGGGVAGGSMFNSIIYFNTAPEGANYFATPYSLCCTTPEGGAGFTNAPMFLNPASGNYRLQSNSPCINAGNNASVVGSTDLDGRMRIVAGAVDMGAYEVQPDVSGEFIGWLSGYHLPTDGSADYADVDADGHNAWQEWRADTNPTNAASVLRLFPPAGSLEGVTVRWQSATTRNYFLERSTNLGFQPAFYLLESNIPGVAGETSFTDTNAVGAGQFFYRVGMH
ncbi:MAG: hypothetical protein KIS67_05905 [Verrucomicrobiae bacterium]|nr:hypothetical protein [Verrucomicrobiae bacterium]